MPLHTVAPVAFTLGPQGGFTVTTIVTLPVHPVAKDPVTVYVVVLVGLAFTVVPVVVFNPVAGLQVYVLAPPTVNVVVCPWQIVAPIPVTTGVVFTVTITVVAPVHPVANDPVTVYVIVAVGFAVTEPPVVPLNPVPGLHVYVVPPLAVKVVDVPLHIVAAGTLTVGMGLTVTTAVVVAVAPAPSLAVTV
jgi:hypothetical protein